MRQLPKCNCQYGAPMGRAEKHLELLAHMPIKLNLQRVLLTEGYDSGGAYWGNRMPVNFTRADGITVRIMPSLYWYHHISPGGIILVSAFIDAVGREQAKAAIREQYPNATFYR